MEGIQPARDLVLSNGIRVNTEIPRAGYIIDFATRKALESKKAEAVDLEDGQGQADTDVIKRQFSRQYERDATTSTANSPAAPSRFYGRDITLNPVKADLSKKSSTCMIADYTMRVRRMILKKWMIENPDCSDVDNLPAALIGGFFMCDGQPTAQLSKLTAADNRKHYLGDDNTTLSDMFPDSPDKDNNNDEFEMWFNEVNNKYGFIGKGKVVAAEDAKEGSGSKFHGKFMAFFGSFHVTLKLHNCRGMMFGNIDQTFYAAWRNTLNKVLCMLFPSDPYQLDCEFPLYILAHYRSAFDK